MRGLHRVISRGHVTGTRGAGAVRLVSIGEYGTPDFWSSYDAAMCERHVPQPGKIPRARDALQGSADYKKIARLDPATVGSMVGPNRRLLRPVDRRLRQSENPPDHPEVAQQIRRQAAHGRHGHASPVARLRLCGRDGQAHGEPVRRHKGALFRRPLRHDRDRRRPRRHPEGLHTRGRGRHRPRRHDRTAARRPLAAVLVARARHEIVIPTAKSGRRIEARIPIYADLRAVLARISRRSPTILTNRFGRPWKTGDGLGTAFTRAKTKAGIGDDLHFHDLRGTAATKFYAAGLPLRVIAEILGWTEGSVDNIIRKYVERDAATKAVIRLLDKRAE